MKHLAHRLLSRPGDIHFQELNFTCFCDKDLLMATALVEECPHSLKSLDITWHPFGTSIQSLCPRR
jgi:hypothetical protein